MSEILQLRGRLAVNERLISTLKVGIETDIDEARMLLDKFIDPDKLRTDKLSVIIDRLNNQVAQIKKLGEQSKQISEVLGI